MQKKIVDAIKQIIIWMKENINFIIYTVIGVIMVVGILWFISTHRQRQIDTAKVLLREFKSAKALKILTNLKSQSKENDIEVDFLIIYSLVKNNNFAKAKTLIEKITVMPAHHEDEVFLIIDKLKQSNEIDLMQLYLTKLKNYSLDQQFFISQSSQMTSLTDEFAILTKGINIIKDSELYAKDTVAATSDILNHLIKRYIEVANVYRGSQKHSIALKYLEQARQLSKDVPHSPYESDIYLNMGMVYKGLNRFSKAWDYINLSAKLGNSKAKNMLKSFERKYSGVY